MKLVRNIQHPTSIIYYLITRLGYTALKILEETRLGYTTFEDIITKVSTKVLILQEDHGVARNTQYKYIQRIFVK